MKTREDAKCFYIIFLQEVSPQHNGRILSLFLFYKCLREAVYLLFIKIIPPIIEPGFGPGVRAPSAGAIPLQATAFFPVSSWTIAGTQF